MNRAWIQTEGNLIKSRAIMADRASVPAVR